MIDEPRYRHHVARLHAAVELALAPALRNPVRQWQAVYRACRAELARGPLRAVHLHGLWPFLVGAVAVRAAGVSSPIFYSPHASESLGRLRSIVSFVLQLLRPVLHTSHSTAIVNVLDEVRAFDTWNMVELVESPVGDAFLTVPRNEARHPLIVTGGRVQSRQSAELMAQLAVLLSGDDLEVSFNWIGSVEPASRLRLQAAQVAVFDATSDAECASRLAAGWIYVAPGGTRGFPVFLVEAMAAALPCVALDCPQHRALIRHGETGFLCDSDRSMIECIAALIDSPALRERIGAAAREEAARRFDAAQFGARLRAAYARRA
jgi:glycosyltransferase involved in cell wall biosynthesis